MKGRPQRFDAQETEDQTITAQAFIDLSWDLLLLQTRSDPTQTEKAAAIQLSLRHFGLQDKWLDLAVDCEISVRPVPSRCVSRMCSTPTIPMKSLTH